MANAFPDAVVQRCMAVIASRPPTDELRLTAERMLANGPRQGGRAKEAAAPAAAAAAAASSATWACQACTFVNMEGAKTCAACGTPRNPARKRDSAPKGRKEAAAPPKRRIENDWEAASDDDDFM